MIRKIYVSLSILIFYLIKDRFITKLLLICNANDEADNLLFISHTLILFGYNFVTATNGKTAFEIASQYCIDLILIDLVLPDINGFDLVKSV